MDKELEVIRHQMEETRSSLADKLGELESQVRGAVEGATNLVADTAETVQETVHTVKETVEETVHDVGEALDLSRHVERHPWAMMGGAVAVGFVGGMLLSPSSVASAASSTYEAASKVAGEEGGALHDAAQSLKGMAVGALMGLVRDYVAKSVPPHYAPDVTKMLDDVTTRLGGKPLPQAPANGDPSAFGAERRTF